MSWRHDPLNIYPTVFVTKLLYTRWFKYDRDYLCVKKSQFVPVIFEPPCKFLVSFSDSKRYIFIYTKHCVVSNLGVLLYTAATMTLS